MSDFNESFDAAMAEAERVLGVDWTMNGVTYRAISADKITVTDRAMAGGRFQNATLTIYVSLEMFTLSSVKKGSILTCASQPVRVLEIDNDGDSSRVLICGPVCVDVPRSK